MDERNLGALEACLDTLVDPAIGVVRRIYEVAREPGSPDFFHFAARAANTAALGFQENFSRTGGASTSKAAAIGKAVGEAVERYCAAMYRVEDLPLGSREELGDVCAEPSAFALHSSEQYRSGGFPWAPFTSSSPIRWTPAIDVAADRMSMVPAAFTWIPYRFDQAVGETPIGQPISTGLACHESWEKSALGGLCEVIERDAFTIFWQARMAPPRIRIETLSDANYDRTRRFEATGDDVTLFDLTTDVGVCVVLAVLRSRTAARPALVFAAAAEPDPEVAVCKALEELAHTRRYSAQCLRMMPTPSPDNDYEEIEHQAHHLRLAADHANVGAFAFLYESPGRVEFADLPRIGADRSTVLPELVGRLGGLGITVYVADLTSPDVRALGLSVTRTVAPGMHPLFMGHRLRALGGRRLYEVPGLLGHPHSDPAQAENPFPHPYP